jgi:hypothetical protein
MSPRSGPSLRGLRHRYVVTNLIVWYLIRGQVGKWKDAQQQWKEAVSRVTSESRERHGQLAAERDAAISQNEATGRELESAKAELQKLSKQSQDLATSAASKPSTDIDSVCFSGPASLPVLTDLSVCIDSRSRSAERAKSCSAGGEYIPQGTTGIVTSQS